MRQDDNIDILWRKRKMPIPAPGLLAPPLVKAAVEENFLSVAGNQVLRPGNRLGGTKKTDLHDFLPLTFFAPEQLPALTT
jgi:hypothetical protein